MKSYTLRPDTVTHTELQFTLSGTMNMLVEGQMSKAASGPDAGLGANGATAAADAAAAAAAGGGATGATGALTASTAARTR